MLADQRGTPAPAVESEKAPTRFPGWRRLVWLALAGLGAVLAAWQLAVRQPAAPPPDPPRDSTPLSEAAFEEATGVRVTLVAVTAQGRFVDFRYQVVDPDKAVIVHDADKPVVIVAETTGLVIDRPWMQHGHSGTLKPGVVYYLLWRNPRGGVQRGDAVSVFIGDFRLEHVTVR